MKKHLLLGLALGIGMCAFAQKPNKPLVKASIANKAYPAAENKVLTGDENIPRTAASHPASSFKPKNVGKIIGGTIYDFQTNASVARRIVNHGNGTITVVWTTSTDPSTYASRGTGYQFYNGTTWLPVVSPTPRLESSKTGWPSIGNIRNNKNEFLMSHDGGAYDLVQGTNASVGSPTPWAFSVSGATTPLAPTTRGGIWDRMVIAGPGDSTIHVIENSSDSTVIRKGVKSPFLYSRSLDGGKTYSIVNATLPGCDSTRTVRSGGDDYAIDAQNNAVAILHGGLAEDVTLWKSLDNGTTFNRILVDSLAFPRDMSGASPTDTMPTNDGQMSVVLDKNNKAHVAYSGSRTLLVSGAVNFFPGTIDLVYWNEINKTKVHIPISVADIDANGDGIYSLADSTTSSTKCRYRTGSVLCMPSIAVDASNNIFIVFSLPADADSTTDGSNQSFRDIWVIASQDNGATWGHAQNVTQTIQEEEAFANVAKLVDSDLHIAYQHDLEPGTALTNGDPDGNNDIMYLKVSVADILAGTAGIKNIASKNDLFSIGQNYPNPFSGTTMFDVNMTKAADLNIEVLNTLGQVVSSQMHKAVAPGKHSFSIETELAPGIYFYTVRANGSALTRKMIVQ